LLSHLLSVIEHLEPAWSRAFLRRTRFLDADFQGDVLAVISLVATALRTGMPLPQITPCPLVDRFILYQHGLNVIRHEADDDYGLPRTMTIDTLENEQYLCVPLSRHCLCWGCRADNGPRFLLFLSALRRGRTTGCFASASRPRSA
jgi:hypothetical protein